MNNIGKYTLYFIKGSLENKEINIINEKEIVVKGIKITFGVLNNGHFISYSKNNITFLTELFSCEELNIKNSENISMKRASFIKRDLLNYVFKVQYISNPSKDKNYFFMDSNVELFDKTENIETSFLLKKEGDILRIKIFHKNLNDSSLIICENIVDLN